METLKKGQEVTVTTKRGMIDGVISSIDTNVCTFDIEYSVDYMKDGKEIVPNTNIEKFIVESIFGENNSIMH